jgi:Zn-finger nucleic acid-binding protein
MTKSELHDIQIDECRECNGIWFDEDELRLAKDASWKDINWIDFEIWKHKDQFKMDPRDLKCPKCQKSLVTIEYGDTKVVIDCCPECKGVWLDGGEFKKIIDFLSEEIYTKSFSEYITEAIEEAKEIITGPESFFSEWKDFKAVLGLLQLRLFIENPELGEAAMNMQKNSPF